MGDLSEDAPKSLIGSDRRKTRPKSDLALFNLLRKSKSYYNHTIAQGFRTHQKFKYSNSAEFQIFLPLVTSKDLRYTSDFDRISSGTLFCCKFRTLFAIFKSCVKREWQQISKELIFGVVQGHRRSKIPQNGLNSVTETFSRIVFYRPNYDATKFSQITENIQTNRNSFSKNLFDQEFITFINK